MLRGVNYLSAKIPPFSQNHS